MDGESYVQLAYEAIFKGDFEQAVDWFQQAMECEPLNAEYAYKASITCARSGKLALALEYANRAVQLVPEQPQYSLHLRMLEAKELTARAQAALDALPAAPERAVPDLLQAVLLDPLSVEARVLLGIGQRMLGKHRDAVIAFRDALQLEPLHNEAARLLREAKAEWRSQLRRRFSNPTTNRNR